MNRRGIRTAALLSIVALLPLPSAVSASTANVFVSPFFTDFGVVNVGESGDDAVLTARSAGPVPEPFTVTSIGITGPDAADFVIAGDQCSGQTVTGCNVFVRFQPLATGPRSAILQVFDDAAGSPHTAALTGIGGPTGIMCISSSAWFSPTYLGQTSASPELFIRNCGNADIVISDIEIQGADLDQFTLANLDCVRALPPTEFATQMCPVDIRFTPTSTGSKSAWLEITSDAPGSPHRVDLTGEALAWADVGVTMSASSTVIRPRQTIDYTFTIANAGPSTASGVQIGAAFLFNAELVSTSIPGFCAAGDGTLSCLTQPIDLAVGSSASVTMRVVVLEPTGRPPKVLATSVTVVAGSPDLVYENNFTSLEVRFVR